MTSAQIQQLARFEQLLKNMDRSVLEEKIERVRQLYPTNEQTVEGYFNQFYQQFEQEEAIQINELELPFPPLVAIFSPIVSFSQQFRQNFGNVNPSTLNIV